MSGRIQFQDQIDEESDVETDSTPETDTEDSDYENDSASDSDDIAPRKCPKGSFDMNNGVCFNPKNRSTTVSLRNNQLRSKKNKPSRTLSKKVRKSSRKSYKKSRKPYRKSSKKSCKPHHTPSKKSRKPSIKSRKPSSYIHHHSGIKKVSSFFENSNVIELTEATFPKDTDTDKFPMIVLFFASWCGYCKEFKPIYTELATKVKDTITLYAVDCDKNKSLASTYHITGFPTLVCITTPTETKLFSDTKKERTLENVLEWIKDQVHSTSTSTKQLGNKKAYYGVETVVNKTIEVTDDFLVKEQQQSGPLFIGTEWCGHCTKMKPEYNRAANENTDTTITFYIANGDTVPGIKEKGKVAGFPTLIWTEKGKLVVEKVFKGERKAENIKKWVDENK